MPACKKKECVSPLECDTASGEAEELKGKKEERERERKKDKDVFIIVYIFFYWPSRQLCSL